jgi:hypothetical protein
VAARFYCFVEATEPGEFDPDPETGDGAPPRDSEGVPR